MVSKHFPDCFHRVSIKGLCVRDGAVLLVKESAVTLTGKWELPGGGLAFGEEIHAGLKREIMEEMGVSVTMISENPIYVWTHLYPPNRRNIGWYYSLVIAYRVELDLSNFHPTKAAECYEFFTEDRLKTIPLAGQTSELASIFHPNDFTTDARSFAIAA